MYEPYATLSLSLSLRKERGRGCRAAFLLQYDRGRVRQWKRFKSRAHDLAVHVSLRKMRGRAGTYRKKNLVVGMDLICRTNFPRRSLLSAERDDGRESGRSEIFNQRALVSTGRKY